MKRKSITTGIPAAVFFCLAGIGQAAIAAQPLTMKEMAAKLQALAVKNEQLMQRVVELEKDTQTKTEVAGKQSGTMPPPVPEELLRVHVHQAVLEELRQQQEKEGMEQKINKYITLCGLIETEAVVGENFDGSNFNEFNVATVELGFDAQMSKWTVGHILAKYEGGEEDEHLFIDEADIQLGNYEKFPLLITAGKFYMPFGNFMTNSKFSRF